MKYYFLLIVAIIAGCTAYTKPYYISGNSIGRIEIFKKADNSMLMQVNEKDSIAALIKIVNFNEGLNYKFDPVYRMDMIKLSEEEGMNDTTSLFLSNNGSMLMVDEPLRNVSGEIKSDKKRFYNLSLDIIEYLNLR